jgi:hypothetical protein
MTTVTLILTMVGADGKYGVSKAAEIKVIVATMNRSVLAVATCLDNSFASSAAEFSFCGLSGPEIVTGLGF